MLMTDDSTAKTLQADSDESRGAGSLDDFRAPHPAVGSLGLTSKDAQRHYEHVKECAIRIAEKLESANTPTLTRRVLEAYLSALGAQYFIDPKVVRAAYEQVCLCVSRPPFPLPPNAGLGDYVGNIEELLNRDPKRSLAEARRLARHGFLKQKQSDDHTGAGKRRRVRAAHR